jgi:hypothetical protein
LQPTNIKPKGKICNPLFPADKVVKATAGSRQFIIHLAFTPALPAFPAELA